MALSVIKKREKKGKGKKNEKGQKKSNVLLNKMSNNSATSDDLDR
jgi:hypothetical protein